MNKYLDIAKSLSVTHANILITIAHGVANTSKGLAEGLWRSRSCINKCLRQLHDLGLVYTGGTIADSGYRWPGNGQERIFSVTSEGRKVVDEIPDLSRKCSFPKPIGRPKKVKVTFETVTVDVDSNTKKSVTPLTYLVKQGYLKKNTKTGKYVITPEGYAVYGALGQFAGWQG